MSKALHDGTELVVLVDTDDQPVGTMDKLEAHHKGVLHRAFSVFLFDDQGRVLLQQRAWGKYHTPGLWSNACCSHVIPFRIKGSSKADWLGRSSRSRR